MVNSAEKADRKRVVWENYLHKIWRDASAKRVAEINEGSAKLLKAKKEREKQ